MPGMATRERPSELGSVKTRHGLAALGRELRAARLDRGLNLDTVARAALMSGSSVSRIERGLVPNVSVLDLARLHETVGLELSIRSYSGGSPVRDRGHVVLLEAFRAALPPTVRWRTEVPVGRVGDRRAWDALIEIGGAGRRGADRYGIEAETSPRDVQGLIRRLTLKRDQGNVEGVVLVLPGTRRVREFLATGGGLLRTEFPVDGTRAIALLRAGQSPGGSAVVVLPGAFIRGPRAVRGPRTSTPGRLASNATPDASRR